MARKQSSLRRRVREVRVDEELGLVRLNRFVGAYDAGRIINPNCSQSAIGGIIWELARR